MPDGFVLAYQEYLFAVKDNSQEMLKNEGT